LAGKSDLKKKKPQQPWATAKAHSKGNETTVFRSMDQRKGGKVISQKRGKQAGAGSLPRIGKKKAANGKTGKPLDTKGKKKPKKREMASFFGDHPGCVN